MSLFERHLAIGRQGCRPQARHLERVLGAPQVHRAQAAKPGRPRHAGIDRAVLDGDELRELRSDVDRVLGVGDQIAHVSIGIDNGVWHGTSLP